MTTQTAIETSTIRDVLLRIAEEATKRGPGFAQESVILRQALEDLKLSWEDVPSQQQMLTCWHDLFRDGKLAWGYDVDNPGPPFFHFARRP
ncbi:MAG TPA: hypothetical protein VGI40_05835 [Pirellulaceae bacterium]|jgi:hypothetical protein